MKGQVKDCTGVPTKELAATYWEHVDVSTEEFSGRIEMSERDLKKIVVEQRYSFQGMSTVERICDGLGIDADELLRSGELTLLPSAAMRSLDKNARRMVEDEIWCKVYAELNFPLSVSASEANRRTDEMVKQRFAEIGDEEIEARIQRLKDLREEKCSLSPEQADRLRRESARNAERKTRERALKRAA